MSYDNNPYYSPEKFGLTTVGEVEWNEPDYSFDFTVVWKDDKGQLYWATDSGCSCPSPFEWAEKLEDLETGSFYDLSKALHANAVDRPYGWDTGKEEAVQRAKGQVVDLLAKLR